MARGWGIRADDIVQSPIPLTTSAAALSQEWDRSVPVQRW